VIDCVLLHEKCVLFATAFCNGLRVLSREWPGPPEQCEIEVRRLARERERASERERERKREREKEREREREIQAKQTDR